PDADLKVELLLDKLEYAAGAERVETLDAQLLAEDFLGDSIVSNILAMGYAWQRGLVPLGLAAMRRAIELNGVAVENNLKAFTLGRLAAADPVACRALLHEPDPASVHPETLDELIEHAVRHLTGYQNARYAERYRTLVAATRAAETALRGGSSGAAETASVADGMGSIGAGGPGAQAALPLTRAVATQMRKLMAYKDEYEVARLYTDGEFERQLHEQFEGDFRLEFYMAPPAWIKPKHGAAPRKVRFGAWLFPLLKVLAKGKGLRGTRFDPFGRSAERRLERRLIDEYEARVHELIAALTPERLQAAVALANVPHDIRGYGHVKLANLAIARARESELLHRFDSARYPRATGAPVAGQFRGIPVTSA
ncbi:MAG: DUF6537 domain-containing protein, partial [Caldimonas sp.]